MKVTKCEKGHFYDGEKYEKCPHCEQKINEEPIRQRDVGRDISSTYSGVLRSQDSNFNAINRRTGQSAVLKKTEDYDVTVAYRPTENDDSSTDKTVAYRPSGNDSSETDKTVAYRPTENVSQPVMKLQPLNMSEMNVQAEKRPQKKNGNVLGWLVVIEGIDKGDFLPLYEGENRIGDVPVMYDKKKKAFYVDVFRSPSPVELDGDLLSVSSYLYHHSVLRILDKSYAVIELCRDGFDWDNCIIVQRTWICDVCNTENLLQSEYCCVCGKKRR